MYKVRKLKIRDSQRESLALASGELYSRTVISFWRTVRKHNLWLKPSSMMRWQNSDQLHAHSADAVVQSFYTALKSWQVRRGEDRKARPPRRVHRFHPVQWKRSAIRLKEDNLTLSNGKNRRPIVIHWMWGIPTLVELGWNGEQYELRCTYTSEATAEPRGVEVAGVDLGETHLAATHDGRECRIYNGRYLRSIQQYRNKKQAEISSKMGRMTRGSKRWKRLSTKKHATLKKLDNQTRDILHKQTTKLVSTLYNRGVQTVAVGDVRGIQRHHNRGERANQKIGQWTHGKTQHFIAYKCEALGITVELQEESYTSQTCPACGERHRQSGHEYRCHCGFHSHRDSVGAYNIRAKYLGNFGIPVVGAMASPIGVRYVP